MKTQWIPFGLQIKIPEFLMSAGEVDVNRLAAQATQVAEATVTAWNKETWDVRILRWTPGDTAEVEWSLKQSHSCCLSLSSNQIACLESEIASSLQRRSFLRVLSETIKSS